MLQVTLDKEAWLAQEIRERVLKNNLNAICIWVGPTGGGKSYSALRLAELVDPSFTLAHLVFRPIDFLDLINQADLPRGSVLVWDEMGLGMPARDWNSLFNKAIGYVLQSFRFRNLALFMTVPDQSFIDSQARRLFHYYFECIEVNREQGFVTAKPFQVQHSARFDKDYMKYPVITLETGPVQVGSVAFRLPSSGIRSSYERKRKDYMDAYYRELRESLEITGASSSVPMWAWRSLLALAEDRTQAEIAGLIQTSREWVNKLLRKANAAIKSGV